MSLSHDLELDDGTPVRFVLAPAGGEVPAAPDDDLPEGMGRAVPVAAGGRVVADFAAGALRGALRPLGPLLEEVHAAATAVQTPPTELSVTFGVQVGQDLKLGIVGGTAQAHLTITANWKPAPQPDVAPTVE
ncbi:CU044_2847 family protein [Streptomyces sp. LaPpAH-108]|uniref:CU044_2847 family protein n=1 Tax=Streptomyces sp. LaPpAH-108 TaxID=1155714 RepID=UPI0003A6DF6D|nr:CU044_2847 family protein [Streptomyces sp. LaPpAH-108]